MKINLVHCTGKPSHKEKNNTNEALQLRYSPVTIVIIKVENEVIFSDRQFLHVQALLWLVVNKSYDKQNVYSEISVYDHLQPRP